MTRSPHPRGQRRMGNVLAPARFVLFVVMLVLACAVAIPWLGWRVGFMGSFDIAAAAFLASCYFLIDKEPEDMRSIARYNDANRVGLLAITGLISIVILTCVASELRQRETPDAMITALIVVTLALAWTFSNAIYALHYAHLYYSESSQSGDRGGLRFPDTQEPNYIDFIYFSFCLGMTFQTSDVEIPGRHFRIVVTLHCLAAFIFNLGVLAFTINVLGG